MSVLGTLNGVGTSISALGRAAGPAVIGAAFSYGVKRGYMIIPWFLLSVLALASIIPAYWIVEQEGPRRDEIDKDEIEQGEEQQEEESPVNGYGTIDVSRDGRKST